MKTPQLHKGNQSAPNSANSNKSAPYHGIFPMRHNTVTAEVLSRLIGGENLTGMDAVFCASTTRLAAVTNYLAAEYGWHIDRVNRDVGTNDGRITVVKVYYLSSAMIRRAFDSGAREFCRSVNASRAKTRKGAYKVKAIAAMRNSARSAANFNANQGTLFGGENGN